MVFNNNIRHELDARLNSCAEDLVTLLRESGNDPRSSLKGEVLHMVDIAIDDIIRMARQDSQGELHIKENSHIRYSFDGHAPESSFGGKYFSSNEYNSKNDETALNGIRDIDGAIGIMGGATQPLKYIDWLSKNNKLEDVILCDESANQLLVGIILIKMHRKMSENNISFESANNAYFKKLLGIKDVQDAHIEIKNDSIENVLATAQPKKYFIYLSNILDFGSRGKGHLWLSPKKTKKFLEKYILYNQNVSRGSYILSNLMPGNVIFKKTRNMLELHYADNTIAGGITESDIKTINKFIESV